MENTTASLPYPESYWVIPNLLMAGEHPSNYDENETRRRIQALIRCGISSFIDLTTHEDTKPSYAGILSAEADEYLKIVKYANFPIRDFEVSSEEQMAKILDAIDAEVDLYHPVYVHCYAGRGRTGMVVGCYLVRHGLQPKEALQRIAELRANIPSSWARSPEADKQVEFVLNWKKGQ